VRLLVGAPVANRDWILPAWFAALAAQTRRPDGFVFVHGGRIEDATWQALHDETAHHGFSDLLIRHDNRPTHPRDDNTRFATLAALRNSMLVMAQWRQADLLLSLDTDILLHDPTTIQRLEQLVTSGDCDIATALTFFHPAAPEHWTPNDEVCWAYNLGFIPSGAPAGERAPWQRPDPIDIPWGSLLRIDIPMGVWLGNQRALHCRYGPHESGEDIGYGYALRDQGAVCLADTSLYCQHVWSPDHLPIPA
jgi:hypothetical protein